MNTQTMVAQLTKHEGRRNKLYVDTVGKASIGVGRNLQDVGIFDDEIDLMLANDIKRSWSQLLMHLPWINTLPESKQHVLLDMTFNMGINGLLHFSKMLESCKKGDYLTASKEMLDSTWASQVHQRAIDLAAAMAS